MSKKRLRGSGSLAGEEEVQAKAPVKSSYEDLSDLNPQDAALVQRLFQCVKDKNLYGFYKIILKSKSISQQVKEKVSSFIDAFYYSIIDRSYESRYLTDSMLREFEGSSEEGAYLHGLFSHFARYNLMASKPEEQNKILRFLLCNDKKNSFKDLENFLSKCAPAAVTHKDTAHNNLLQFAIQGGNHEGLDKLVLADLKSIGLNNLNKQGYDALSMICMFSSQSDSNPEDDEEIAVSMLRTISVHPEFVSYFTKKKQEELETRALQMGRTKIVDLLNLVSDSVKAGWHMEPKRTDGVDPKGVELRVEPSELLTTKPSTEGVSVPHAAESVAPIGALSRQAFSRQPVISDGGIPWAPYNISKGSSGLLKKTIGGASEGLDQSSILEEEKSFFEEQPAAKKIREFGEWLKEFMDKSKAPTSPSTVPLQQPVINSVPTAVIPLPVVSQSNDVAYRQRDDASGEDSSRGSWRNKVTQPTLRKKAPSLRALQSRAHISP